MNSFKEFWPYYVRQHLNPLNRSLHFAGMTAGLLLGTYSVVFEDWPLLALAFGVGYLASFAGHFFVEHNKPASFKHPLWSLRAGLKMWWLTWRDEMDVEIEQATWRGE